MSSENKIKGFIVIIPAYNEERSIERCLESIIEARNMSHHPLKQVIICLNGCTDNTQPLVERYKTRLPLTAIKSAPGYINAMNQLLGYARLNYPNTAFIKLDADSSVSPGAFDIMLDQFDRHSELIIVGGHPLPIISTALRWRQKLLARLFSLRSLYPLAQVANNDLRLITTIIEPIHSPG